MPLSIVLMKKWFVLTFALLHPLLLLSDALAESSDEQQPWVVGIALGYGERSNPLIASEDIQLWGLLDIAYYGEYAFFDNGDLGLYLFQDEQQAVNLVFSANNEREYYQHLNHRQYFFNQTLSASPPNVQNNPSLPDDVVVQEIELPDRDYAVLTGLEWLLENSFGDWHVQALADISDTHHGYELWSSWSHDWQVQDWTFRAGLALNWKSKDLVDYYYGVTATEVNDILTEYHGKSTLNYLVKVGVSYAINNKVNWVITAKQEYLGSGISDSPMVSDKQVVTYFTGFTYHWLKR